MGRKLNLTSLFFRPNGDTSTPSSSSSFSSPSSSSWAWPPCKHPRTDSFRCGPDVYKTVNSVYFDSTDSSFTQSSEDYSAESLSAIVSDEEFEAAVIRRGLMSTDRLLFEPGGDTSSILDESMTSTTTTMIPFKESVAMAMESRDPYGDFRSSMEEMVVAHGMRDWERLEKLLAWYLRVNGKKNHGFIVGAFVDLLVALGSPAETETETETEKDHAASCSCSSNSISSVSFEIEEVEEGNGSC